MLSTAVGDAEGNIYFSGQATQIADRFSTDILYGKINADGSLAWAKLWNGPYKDCSPDSGQNAETSSTPTASRSTNKATFTCAASTATTSRTAFSPR